MGVSRQLLFFGQTSPLNIEKQSEFKFSSTDKRLMVAARLKVKTD